MTTETEYLFDTREAWLGGFMDAAAPKFESMGYPLPENIRISINEPTASKRGKGALGKCFHPTESASGHWEIFLNPVIETVTRLADVLTHELIHTVCFNDGHGKTFGTIARALGLDGALTKTEAGAGWFKWAAPIIEALGPMPYAPMNNPARKVSETYLLKLECDQCGWLARVSKKHVFANMTCPDMECGGNLLATDKAGNVVNNANG